MYDMRVQEEGKDTREKIYQLIIKSQPQSEDARQESFVFQANTHAAAGHVDAA
jgi:hypothetical protein